MTIISLPRMFISKTEGWTDLIRMHPSVAQLSACVVMPLALLPPLMYAFAQVDYPGSIFPSTQPPLSVNEAVLVGGFFFMVELLAVALMTVYIRQIGDLVANRPYRHEAFMLAAVAPIPLWLSSLALFVPNLWVNLLFVGIAWIGSATLIRQGVKPLFRLEDGEKASRMANVIIVTGVSAWVALIVVLELTLSLVVGFR